VGSLIDYDEEIERNKSAVISPLDRLVFEERKENEITEQKVPINHNKHAIASIEVDPANFILTSSRGGQIVALTPFERRHNYYYLELGEDTFCTVGLPSARAKEIGAETDTMDLNMMSRCCI